LNLLVVSPHADDETLGAGGLILKYKDAGWNVCWLNVTSVKEEYGFSAEVVVKREKEIQEVNRLFQFDNFINLSLKPANLDIYNKSDLVSRFSSVISKIQPEIVIIPFYNDVHSDHRIVFETIYSCTKSFRYPYLKKILCMEILSETDFAMSDHGFIPNYFVDITKYIDQKIKIMQVYKSEIAPPPFPRSIENIKSLARVRGSSCGCEFAEGFRLLKGIES
jgi:LmbE family N-acetylglucosaminyl deacetylase